MCVLADLFYSTGKLPELIDNVIMNAEKLFIKTRPST